MALAMVVELPGLTREEYETVVRAVAEQGTPAGALFHGGGPVEDGYRVVEVWESRDAADAFYSSNLLQTATATITAEPRVVMTWPVHGVDDGTGWRAIG
jgi:hypothetical protein